MERCSKCNRNLKSKGLIYGTYRLFRICICGYNNNPNFLIKGKIKYT